MYRSPVLNDMVYRFTGKPGQLIKIYVEDLEGRMQFYGEDTTNQDGLLDIEMDTLGGYDRTVAMTIYDAYGNILASESITVVRPYFLKYLVDNMVDGRVTDEARLHEAMVRATIDSITGGFYFKRKVISYDAMGGDALPLESGIVRIVRAWQNGGLVYQYGGNNIVDFIISRDRTAIVVDSEYYNRRYGNDPALPWAPSDIYGYDRVGYGSIVRRNHRSGQFLAGTDFEFDVEYGYRTIPGDIELAAQLLTNDPACVNTYLNNYIVEYDTDQYRIKYDRAALQGTGNRQVDRILSRYQLTGSQGFRAAIL